jgi:hypothetical protein
MTWQLLWKIMLIFTLCGYAALVCIVCVGGIFNIRDMLKDLLSGDNDQQE